jgi:hypothetical protein
MSADEEWEVSFLKQAREGLALSSDDQGRHLARFESNLAGGIAPSVINDPAFETSALTKHVTQVAELGATTMGWLWQVHPLFLVSGGLIVGGLGGLFVGHELSPRSSPTAVSAATSSEKTLSDAFGASKVLPPPIEAIQLEDLEEQGSEPGMAAAPAKQSKALVPGDEPAEPTFYEELSYLRRAQAALRGGKPALALGIMTSLDEMQRVGALDLERRVTKALALCDLGRAAEAKAVSAPIFKQQAHSVYVKRLKESCVGALPADSEMKE